jgi:hypothetical protein
MGENCDDNILIKSFTFGILYVVLFVILKQLLQRFYPVSVLFYPEIRTSYSIGPNWIFFITSGRRHSPISEKLFLNKNKNGGQCQKLNNCLQKIMRLPLNILCKTLNNPFPQTVSILQSLYAHRIVRLCFLNAQSCFLLEVGPCCVRAPR